MTPPAARCSAVHSMTCGAALWRMTGPSAGPGSWCLAASSKLLSESEVNSSIFPSLQLRLDLRGKRGRDAVDRGNLFDRRLLYRTERSKVADQRFPALGADTGHFVEA